MNGRPFLTGTKGSGSQEFTIVIPEKEVVAQGQITPLTVILAKAGIHFSPHTPDFNGVEKGLNP